MGDLSAIGADKEAMKTKLARTRPGAKPGAIPVWAGVLLRFAHEMPGDLVIYPYKPDSTLLRAHRERLLLRPFGLASSPGGDELGLFVTLGAYSKDAVHLGRTRQDLRLVNGTDLVALQAPTGNGAAAEGVTAADEQDAVDALLPDEPVG